MLVIVGIVVVIASVLGGYGMAKGPFAVLYQPAELVTIIGAGIGTVILGTPMKVLKQLGAALPAIFKGSPYTKAAYIELLTMQFEVFSKMRKNGLLALEEDVADPHASPTFQSYPKFLNNKKAATFFCDSLKLLIDGTARHMLFDVRKDIGERDDVAQSQTGVVRRLYQQLQAWEKDVDAEAKAATPLARQPVANLEHPR